MSEMTVKQITEYLKVASELEVSVYKQERTRQQARKNLVLRDVPSPDLTEPEKSTTSYESLLQMVRNGEFRDLAGKKYTTELKTILQPLSTLKCPVVKDKFVDNPDLMLKPGIISFILLAVCFIIGLVTQNFILLPVSMILLIFPLTLIGVWLTYGPAVKKVKAKVGDVHRDLEKYYTECYERKMVQYQENKQKQEKQYSTDLAIAKQNYAKAQAEVVKLDAPLEETKDLLEKLYAADVIFPKYRNMVAMCTMYEYFASGRCTELTGPNGAYNLYEQELRQNLIINQLENINANLEQVKQNQYILYQGITETNQTLRTISDDVRRLVNATEDMAASNQITAFCAQVTAANTQAIKYISVFNTLF